MGLHGRDIGSGLANSFCQPIGQGLPNDMLALLVAIDRQHRAQQTSAPNASIDPEQYRASVR